VNRLLLPRRSTEADHGDSRLRGKVASSLLAATLALVLGGASARADKVGDLAQALTTSKTEKTRISAVVSLGRMKDARAVKPLIRALSDESNVVRAPFHRLVAVA
jgi:HEAT repeat protein